MEHTEPKFTKGPWKLCGSERGGCSCYSVGAPDRPIATVEHGEWGDRYCDIRLVDNPNGIGKVAEAFMNFTGYGKIDETEAKANAYLIAAAPDLYVALRDFVWITEGNGAVKTAALAALAKAEGNTTP
jgi:hypothetical protein